MTEYDFTLKFRLPDANGNPELHIGALAEAGCEDAMVGIGQPGRIALDFTREATSAMAAIVSAVQAVKRAIPGAELVEASPDLVGLTDVAEWVGCTRQNIRKLMLGNRATFPVAVHEGSLALWHLRPVLAWFHEHQQRAIDPALLEVSEATMHVNIANQARRLPGDRARRQLDKLFA